MRTLGVTLATALLFSLPVSAQTIIDTGEPGSEAVPGSGVGYNNQNFFVSGQSFTVPTLHTLYSFSFTVFQGFPGAAPLQPYGWLQAWTGTSLSGPVLYAGGPASSVVNSPWGTPGVRQIYTWDITGGLALTAGAQYVAFLTGDLALANPGWAAIQGIGADSYTGGAAVLGSPSSNGLPGSLTQSNWGAVGGDLRFRAEFAGPSSTVPEPGTVFLLGTGLLGLGLAAWRRREQDPD